MQDPYRGTNGLRGPAVGPCPSAGSRPAAIAARPCRARALSARAIASRRGGRFQRSASQCEMVVLSYPRESAWCRCGCACPRGEQDSVREPGKSASPSSRCSSCSRFTLGRKWGMVQRDYARVSINLARKHEPMPRWTAKAGLADGRSCGQRDGSAKEGQTRV